MKDFIKVLLVCIAMPIMLIIALKVTAGKTTGWETTAGVYITDELTPEENIRMIVEDIQSNFDFFFPDINPIPLLRKEIENEY